jgi:hypothetical protein
VKNEDATFMLLHGSKKFAKQIKDRHISGDPDPAFPQQKSIINERLIFRNL